MIGTVVDYAIFIGLKDIFQVWYIYANIWGASMGAITNFLLGRYWAFDSQKDKLSHQAFRYALVA